jgi:hypothetical protein
MHIDFQIKLAGGQPGAEGSGNGSSGEALHAKSQQFDGPTPDDIPDIGMMVAVERA